MIDSVTPDGSKIIRRHIHVATKGDSVKVCCVTLDVKV